MNRMLKLPVAIYYVMLRINRLFGKPCDWCNRIFTDVSPKKKLPLVPVIMGPANNHKAGATILTLIFRFISVASEKNWQQPVSALTYPMNL